ncbi:MAG: Asr1405/Asl0597 family protein [Elainellaceae cyanobacterium]
MSIDNQNQQIESPQQWLEVNCAPSWEIYWRLQELEIPCSRKPYQPLWVQIDTPLSALQMWSVCQSIAQPKSALTDWLERCWSLKVDAPISHEQSLS